MVVLWKIFKIGESIPNEVIIDLINPFLQLNKKMFQSFVWGYIFAVSILFLKEVFKLSSIINS